MKLKKESGFLKPSDYFRRSETSFEQPQHTLIQRDNDRRHFYDFIIEGPVAPPSDDDFDDPVEL